MKAGSEKEIGEEKLVEIIRQIGIPSIIATDVSPTPYFVRKVAARFNVKVYAPEKSMKVEEKRIIGKDILDPHVRDAYAAATKAHRNFANRLRQIEKMQITDKEKLKHLVIQGIPIGKV